MFIKNWWNAMVRFVSGAEKKQSSPSTTLPRYQQEEEIPTTTFNSSVTPATDGKVNEQSTTVLSEEVIQEHLTQMLNAIKTYDRNLESLMTRIWGYTPDSGNGFSDSDIRLSHIINFLMFHPKGGKSRLDYHKAGEALAELVPVFQTVKHYIEKGKQEEDLILRQLRGDN